MLMLQDYNEAMEVEIFRSKSYQVRVTLTKLRVYDIM